MNEVLLLTTALFSTLFVYTAWRIGEERLYTAIVIFLILIATVGGKLVEFFGYATNTGNIFYAAVFLATYFLLERYGKRGGIRALWIGALVVGFFTILVQIVVLYQGNDTSRTLNEALQTVFGSSLRITIASLIAYVVSQSFNVHVYIYLKERFNDQYRWLRANVTNALAQILDSIVFFLIAFWGVVTPDNLDEVIITGILIKIIYMAVAAPLLYLNNVEHGEKEGYPAITLR